MTKCNHHHHHHEDGHGALIRRMDLLTSGTAGLAAVAMASSGLGIPQASAAGLAAYADPENPALPASTMELEKGRAALLIVDP